MKDRPASDPSIGSTSSHELPKPKADDYDSGAGAWISALLGLLAWVAWPLAAREYREEAAAFFLLSLGLSIAAMVCGRNALGDIKAGFTSPQGRTLARCGFGLGVGIWVFLFAGSVHFIFFEGFGVN